MLTNKQIARAFDDLANLLELHDDNEFKIKSYRNAYITLRKLDRPVAEMSLEEVKSIKGIGPAISAKIKELVENGRMDNLEDMKAKTPPGVVEMLDINGFGPKKVRVVWQEMGLETVGELWYACNENRLVEYKGFGLKTQEDLKQKIEYFLRSSGKMHLDWAMTLANQACGIITQGMKGAFVAPVGEVRRACSTVSKVEILVGFNGDLELELPRLFEHWKALETGYSVQLSEAGGEVLIHRCMQEEFGSKLFRHTGTEAFLQAFVEAAGAGANFRSLRTEQEIFERAGIPYIIPELREDGEFIAAVKGHGELPRYIEYQDIRGVLHVHTTWSDGLHSLRQMCEAARDRGFEYIGITDHSASAFYANGLKSDRLLAQIAEIRALEKEMMPFRIFCGVESDILNDGSLDYSDDVLSKLDFVIASVHSNLKMSREKATERLLRAIENPYTTILGHPTGRLLLSREGYPLDWDAILTACQQYGVAIELNANPHRLDIDWSLIARAAAMNIPISINPDAHSQTGIDDIRYGIPTARKGGLMSDQCLNARDAAAFEIWLNKRKK